MKTKRATRKKTYVKKDIYKDITDILLDKIENGVIPWKTPHMAQVGFPVNYESQKQYRGSNLMLLAMMGYTRPFFMTYLQAKKAGGNVKKGEKGYRVIKWGEFKKKDAPEDEKGTFYLKSFTVFNACQIEGVEFPEVKLPDFTPSQKVEKAKAIVEGMPNPPEFREGRGVESCYWPSKDIVDLPAREYFESEERFYQTYFHELVHATGASNRLNRPSLVENNGMHATKKGVYEYEELVAEIGASFLMAHAGIVLDEHEQNAAYLKGWLNALKKDDHKKWFIKASGDAQKAVDYILGIDKKTEK